MRERIRGEDGVSVIVGTLLLILIVVTGATALAMMTSQMQKETMIRESHLRNVEAEEIRFQTIRLVNDPEVWLKANISGSRNWSSLAVTVLNVNTKDAYITGFSVNDRYSYNFTCTENPGELFNLTRRFQIPATKSREIRVNLTGIDSPLLTFDPSLAIDREEAVTVRMVTSYQNIFDETFEPPIAVVRYRIETENLGVADRAVLVLDGSESLDDGVIRDWNWSVTNGTYTVFGPGNWTDTRNLTPRYYGGPQVRVTDSSPGPFQVNLVVTDDCGMTGSSRMVEVPANPTFSPATRVVVTKEDYPPLQNSTSGTPSWIRARVLNIEGNGVPDSMVSFVVQYGDLILDNAYNTTGPGGTASATVQAGTAGIVRILSGKLPPVDISL